MSKKSKNAAKMTRLKAKRAKRAQKTALYESYRASGKNQKSKRARQNKKMEAKVKVFKHKVSNCGNAGCERCNVIIFAPFLKDGKPHRMPSKIYNKWIENG